MSVKFLWAAVCLLCASMVQAITIDIEKGRETAQPISVVPFVTTGTNADMAAVIANDLSLSGRFAPVARTLMPASPANMQAVNFTDWRALAGNMVVGSLTKSDKQLSMQVELIDVYAQKSLAQYQYTLPDDTPKTVRKVGHKISDLIYEKLTGKRGFFSTKIAYVTKTGTGANKRYTLDIAGVDGRDAVSVVQSRKAILSPSWSPDARKIAYVSFETERAEIWVNDLKTGKRSRVTNFPGNSSSPSWSPDGKKFAVTLTKDGNPEVYIVHLSGGLSRLTKHPAADTEATWGPDSQTVYFLSDRSGQAQIYRKDLGSGNLQRMTTAGSYNASPDVADDNSSMALLHQLDNKYVVAVQDFATGEIDIVSRTEDDEAPSFAPNSDMIVYASKYQGRGVITITNKLGTVHRVYSSGSKDIREPEWSPYLH